MKGKRYEPEMGQAVFGNPTGEYDVGDLGRACLMAVLDEIDRVYWNVRQQEWNRHKDPEIPGVRFRPYYWGDDDAEAVLPNLEAHGVAIRWYKHPGRGTTVDRDMSPEDWAEWLSSTLATVCAADVLP